MSGSDAPVPHRCAHCGEDCPPGDSHTCAPRPDGEARIGRGDVAELPAGPAPSGTEATLDGSVPLRGITIPEQPSSSAIDNLIGTVLGGRYQIVERLGEGGMGIVFRARHIVLEHMLAVKLLLKSQESAAQTRFFQEAKLASRLTHPNTVKISDFGLTPDGRPYLVMEFVQGPTLRQALLSAGPLAPLRACRIAVQIARGLHAVHELGSVHRDLKPENIFVLDQDGQRDFVKIFDFGIAAQTAGAAPADLRSAPSLPLRGSASSYPDDEALARGRMTMPGMLLGTPHYMSPEQAFGGDVDARADQYALGCILYEMLVGEVPFEAPTLKRLLKLHMEELPEPLRKRLPGLGISDELEALVLRLLAKDPGARFPSMREVEQALEGQIDRLQRPPGMAPSRRRARATLLAVPGLLAVLAVGYAGVRLGAPRSPGIQSTLSVAELGTLHRLALEVLQRDLLAPEPAIRRGALQRLGSTHEGSARSAVEALLRDPDGEVKAQAALALGHLGDRAAVAALRPLLDPATPANVRAAAAGALDQLGDPTGTELLRSALGGTSAELRQRAAYLLCERGGAQAAAVLSELAARAPADEALSLLGRLALCGSSSARDQLRAQLRGSAERALQAAGVLVQGGDAEGRAHLLALAQRPGPAQLPAARLLAGPEEPALNDLFRRILREDHPAAAKILAVEGLGLGGERADAARVAAFLKDANEPRLRQAAAAAVLQIAAREPGAMSEQALAWARGATLDGDWVARQAAAEVLGGSSSPEAAALLAKLLDDQDARVRLGAIRALGRRRDRAALDLLHTGLRDSSAEVRKDALVSLEKVTGFLMRSGARSLAQEVSGWLGDSIQNGTPEEQVLGSALLVSLGDRSQLGRLRAFLSAPEESLRLLAVQKAPADAALLTPLLSDASQAVRFAAAVRLAEVPALPAEQREVVKTLLRAGLERGGADAVTAYGRLLRLGERGPALSEIEAQLRSGDTGARMAAVEACGLLPPRLALPLLGTAARDPEPLVRQMVIEVAAELPAQDGEPAGLRLLRQLAGDSEVRVRARALLLLSRMAGAAGAEPARNQQTEVPPAADRNPSVSTPPTGAAQTDGRVPPADSQSQPAPAPQPAAVSVRPEDPATPAPPANTRRELPLPFEKTLKAIARKNSERARVELEKATTLCVTGKLPGADCGRLAYEGGSRLGLLYEQQGQWGEAMVEYERMQSRVASLKLAPDQAAALAQARKRLEPRVGRIVVPKKVGSRCQEVLIWMKIGTHQIEVDDEAQVVTVRPGETTRVGSCK